MGMNVEEFDDHGKEEVCKVQDAGKSGCRIYASLVKVYEIFTVCLTNNISAE
jgi:hypothetical protein